MRNGDSDFRLDEVAEAGDRAAVVFSWSDRAGNRHRWAQAMRMRDGLIVDLQDYADPAKALETLRTS